MGNELYFGGGGFTLNSFVAPNFSNKLGGVFQGFNLDIMGIEFPSLLIDSYRGSAIGKISYSYVGGDSSVWGSRRHQLSLHGGWKQHLFGNVGFLDSLVGLGFNINSMSLGRGLPLEEELNGSFMASIGIGVDFCVFNSAFCWTPTISYQFEHTLSNPDYMVHSLNFGIRFGGKPSVVDREKFEEYEVKAEGYDELVASHGREISVLERAHQKRIEEIDTEFDNRTQTMRTTIVELNKELAWHKRIFLSTVFDLPLPTKGSDWDLTKIEDLIYNFSQSSQVIKLHVISPSSSNANQDKLNSLKYAQVVRELLIELGIAKDRLILDAKLSPDKSTVIGSSIHGSGREALPPSATDAIRNCDNKTCVLFETVGVNPNNGKND